mmetsp:Transcript_3502/g.9359  ORF Transcript_3502/g.9359 Transcript_3502/m.9359 type:complete len:239 (-) Transcript_3502:1756-2472(-)
MSRLRTRWKAVAAMVPLGPAPAPTPTTSGLNMCAGRWEQLELMGGPWAPVVLLRRGCCALLVERRKGGLRAPAPLLWWPLLCALEWVSAPGGPMASCRASAPLMEVPPCATRGLSTEPPWLRMRKGVEACGPFMGGGPAPLLLAVMEELLESWRWALLAEISRLGGRPVTWTSFLENSTLGPRCTELRRCVGSTKDRACEGRRLMLQLSAIGWGWGACALVCGCKCWLPSEGAPRPCC